MEYCPGTWPDGVAVLPLEDAFAEQAARLTELLGKPTTKTRRRPPTITWMLPNGGRVRLILRHATRPGASPRRLGRDQASGAALPRERPAGHHDLGRLHRSPRQRPAPFEDLVYLTVQVTDDPKVWFQAAIRAEGDDLLLHTTDSLPDEVAQELREAGWQPDEMDCLDRTIVRPASDAAYRTAAGRAGPRHTRAAHPPPLNGAAGGLSAPSRARGRSGSRWRIRGRSWSAIPRWNAAWSRSAGSRSPR